MSAYSEWKHGLITYDQYRTACAIEEAYDKAHEEAFERLVEAIDEIEDEDEDEMIDYPWPSD